MPTPANTKNMQVYSQDLGCLLSEWMGFPTSNEPEDSSVNLFVAGKRLWSQYSPST